ncbi:MAG: hypothetical protein ABSF26_05805 [Thermoguttaceae bacterium]|jgi:hypothetical protein
MPTTSNIFSKQIGNVRVEITEESTLGKLSHKIEFTCKQDDGSESHTFRGEGDLAQLNTAAWRAQEWLNRRQEA